MTIIDARQAVIAANYHMAQAVGRQALGLRAEVTPIQARWAQKAYMLACEGDTASAKAYRTHCLSPAFGH